jgi:2-(1,2-epoxy-1,2-dihydrophenyl)acetyl-CoA isomerase
LAGEELSVGHRYILYETQERVAVITLNRPEKLNAWIGEMAVEIGDALREANEDDNVGAIVVTGAGRAFCAGADVIEAFKRRADAQDAGTLAETEESGADAGLAPLQEPLHYGKPSIAAINGYAVGVGLTFPLNCDIRIASEEAKLNTMFLRVGLIPEFGSSYLLPRIVGLGKACELVYMPRMIEAREAYEIGLVNKVVPADRLMPEAMELAKVIAKGPPFALRKAKEAIFRNLDATCPEASARELQFFAQCLATAEHREGIRAFMENREPDFHRPELRS